jgi:hypothetical protein
MHDKFIVVCSKSVLIRPPENFKRFMHDKFIVVCSKSVLIRPPEPKQLHEVVSGLYQTSYAEAGCKLKDY